MPDVTSVRSLITSVTAISNHLNVTPNAVYRWIGVNRIPGKHMVKVANFYDIEIPLHLGTSDEKNKVKLRYKPRNTLPLCLAVQRGEMNEADAAQALGLHPRAVQLIIKNWGEQLGLLYETLLKLHDKEISLDDAAATLQVSKFNIHALRKKYGFQPAPRPKPEPRAIVKRRMTSKSVAMACIAGQLNLKDVEKECDLSWRTIHRAITKLSPEYSLIDLTHWPKALRQAYSHEIAGNAPKTSVKLWKFAQTAGVLMPKRPKYPEIPKNWREVPLRRMMIHVLLGDETVQSVAEKRGADPAILEGLFTGDLRTIGMTWEEATGASVFTQAALAELLMAVDAAKKTPRLRMLEKIAEEKHDG